MVRDSVPGSGPPQLTVYDPFATLLVHSVKQMGVEKQTHSYRAPPLRRGEVLSR